MHIYIYDRCVFSGWLDLFEIQIKHLRPQVATSLLREAINAKLQPSMSATANVVLTSFARWEEQGTEV